MIEVVIDSIRASLMTEQRIVILKDLHQERFLPIFIGRFEADAITIELRGDQHSRPFTHDLMKSLITEMGGKVAYIFINDLRMDTFFARIVIEINDQKIEVDARPSDAIALAVRVKAPLFVSEAVMDKSAVEPEEDVEIEATRGARSEPKRTVVGEEPATDEAPADEKVDSSKLSAFADFLNTLDIDLEDDDSKKQ